MLVATLDVVFGEVVCVMTREMAGEANEMWLMCAWDGHSLRCPYGAGCGGP